MSMLSDIQNQLETQGISPEVRRQIRNSKICIVDDKIEDLKGLTEGLRQEGFTNISELAHVTSWSQLLESGYDLIVLDLVGVGADICEQDGLGILSSIKKSDPSLAVLVVSGSLTSPQAAAILSEADLIRTKPLLSGDLAADVEQILRIRKDPFWSAFAVLQELNSLMPIIGARLGILERISLWWTKRTICSKIMSQDVSLMTQLQSIVELAEKLGSPALKIVRLIHGLKTS